MKLMQCFPNPLVRADILARAAAAGVLACEEGICIHFDTVQNWEELSRVLGVLNSARNLPDSQAETEVQIIEFC